MRQFIIIIFAATLIFFTEVRAFEATSTGFELHSAGFVNTKGGFATSTGFTNLSAGGQTATGISTSTSRTDYSGILYLFDSSFLPVYTQSRYRWRNDDGSESAATWAAAEDTVLSNLAKSTIKRLRFTIANRGWTRGAGPQFLIEFAQTATCSAGTYAAVPTGTGSDWQVVDSTNITDGNTTTNQLTSANAFFKAGYVKDTANQTAALTLSSEEFTEIEYSIQANSSALDGGSYCFRLSDAGSTSTFSYSVYPRVTIFTADTLSVSIDTSTISFPSLSPGFPVYATSTITVTTTNATGFSISVNRQSPTTTMYLATDNTITIPDRTNWVAPANTSTAGNSATYTSGNGLGFRVAQNGTDSGNYASAWWGTNDQSANALFAGFPTSSQQIANRSTDSSPATLANVSYKLDVPQNQNNGNYTGQITYTIVANP